MIIGHGTVAGGVPPMYPLLLPLFIISFGPLSKSSISADVAIGRTDGLLSPNCLKDSDKLSNELEFSPIRPQST